MDENEPVKTTDKPKRGGKPQTQEHMAEISKMGVEVRKKISAIKAYEKEQKRKEIDEKFELIQNEKNKTLPLQEEEQEEEEPKLIKKQNKPKKYIIEEEEESSSSEEEIIIKKVVRKKKTINPKENNDIIEKSNLEMLRNKYNQDRNRRIMESLFDY